MAFLLNPSSIKPLSSIFGNLAQHNLIQKTLVSTLQMTSTQSKQDVSYLQRRQMSNISTCFSFSGIVPDSIDDAPLNVAKIKYYIPVEMGNTICPFQARHKPCVRYPAKCDRFYTLVMFDPDTPSRCKNTDAEWHHWFVGNIPGDNVAKGDIIYDYIPPCPPMSSGIHRIVFLIWEQQSRIYFTEPKLCCTRIDGRKNQRVRSIVCKYNLGKPFAGNFFRTCWDQYVPLVYLQMGVEQR